MYYYDSEGMFPNEGNLCMGQGKNVSVGENEGFLWERKGMYPIKICFRIRKIHSLHSSFLVSQTTIIVFKINRSFVLTLFIFKAPNYVLARTLTERVV